jgi:hypothetical protein
MLEKYKRVDGLGGQHTAMHISTLTINKPCRNFVHGIGLTRRCGPELGKSWKKSSSSSLISSAIRDCVGVL